MLKRKKTFDAFSEKYIKSTKKLYRTNQDLKLDLPEDEILLTKEDVIGTIKYVIGLNNGKGHTDDIDNLSILNEESEILLNIIDKLNYEKVLNQIVIDSSIIFVSSISQK